jgi:hypothetical protein
LFREKFSDVYEAFRIIKKDDYTLLSYILQKIETTVFIENVSRQIAAERPDLPIFTIHDSIATYPEERKYVARNIKDEVKRLLGLHATTAFEPWG